MLTALGLQDYFWGWLFCQKGARIFDVKSILVVYYSKALCVQLVELNVAGCRWCAPGATVPLQGLETGAQSARLTLLHHHSARADWKMAATLWQWAHSGALHVSTLTLPSHSDWAPLISQHLAHPPILYSLGFSCILAHDPPTHELWRVCLCAGMGPQGVGCSVQSATCWSGWRWSRRWMCSRVWSTAAWTAPSSYPHWYAHPHMYFSPLISLGVFTMPSFFHSNYGDTQVLCAM